MTPGKCPSTHVHHLADCKPALLRQFQSGASIHAHTHFSHENLSFLPEYTAKIPVVSGFVQRVADKYQLRTGLPLDFGAAYWTPPLPPAEVFASETRQINECFGLNAIVSLTDHDDFRAPLSMPDTLPLSTEWTVHFENTYLHLGVHNLESRTASVVTTEMKRISEGSSTVSAADLLALLDQSPDTLVVLNHPLWDVEGSTDEAHRGMLFRFLGKYREFLHALEVNGFRPWQENREVLALGETWKLPVVAGGDRHGVTPNMLVNLSHASSFPEFASEIRHDQVSDVVLMPAYSDPMFTKQFRTAGDALGYYPTHPSERQNWPGRVFFEEVPGEPRSIGSMMKQGMPGWLAVVTSAARSFGKGPVHDTLNRLLPREKISLSPNPARSDFSSERNPPSRAVDEAVHEDVTSLL